MGKSKVKIKVSGTPKQVKNALQTLTNSAPDAPILREADFRNKAKQGKI